MRRAPRLPPTRPADPRESEQPLQQERAAPKRPERDAPLPGLLDARQVQRRPGWSPSKIRALLGEGPWSLEAIEAAELSAAFELMGEPLQPPEPTAQLRRQLRRRARERLALGAIHFESSANLIRRALERDAAQAQDPGRAARSRQTRRRFEAALSRSGHPQAQAAASPPKSSEAADPLSSNPLSSNPLSSNPLSSDPLSSDPLSSDPLSSEEWSFICRISLNLARHQATPYDTGRQKDPQRPAGISARQDHYAVLRLTLSVLALAYPWLTTAARARLRRTRLPGPHQLASMHELSPQTQRMIADHRARDHGFPAPLSAPEHSRTSAS